MANANPTSLEFTEAYGAGYQAGGDSSSAAAFREGAAEAGGYAALYYRGIASGTPAGAIVDAMADIAENGPTPENISQLAFGLYGVLGVAAGEAGVAGRATSDAKTGPYAEMRQGSKGTKLQANHLYQNAAFKSVVENMDGVSHMIKGDAIKSFGPPHNVFHRSLEEFWDQYRKNGAKLGQRATIAEYEAAVERALRKAGISEADIKKIMKEAKEFRKETMKLNDTDLVPRVPGKMNVPKPPDNGADCGK